jgi:hypothetical protein
MPCSSTSSKAAVTIRSSDRPRPGRRRRPRSTRACATGPHLETTVVMVAVSSDRHPQPTTSLLMIILKVSCRTSPFSGPQRQSAAGTRGVSGYGMAPGVIMRPGAGQRWRPCRDCVVARGICRQGQAVRDVAGGDQPRADQGCSEMFDGPWDPVVGPSGHHRCVDLGGDIRQAHPPPRPPPVGLTRGARTREKPCRALAARHASVQESGAAARAASHSPASRASSTAALPPTGSRTIIGHPSHCCAGRKETPL